LRAADILRIALSALYQQKLRTLLTVIGVLVGTFILILSLSLGQGVRGAVIREFRQHDQLRQVYVHTGYKARESDIPPEELTIEGPMSVAKRERLRKAAVRWWSRNHAVRAIKPLTPERLRDLAAIDHVSEVVPLVFLPCRVTSGQKSSEVRSCGAPANDRSLRNRLVAGAMFPSDQSHGVLIHEYLLYRWGIISDDQVNQVLGHKIRLVCHLGRPSPGMLLNLLNRGPTSLSLPEDQVLQKVVKQLPTALDHLDLTPAEREILRRLLESPTRNPLKTKEVVLTEEFTISGVIREFTDEDRETGWVPGSVSNDADVYLPMQTAVSLLAGATEYAQEGFPSATITVDQEDNVAEVVRRIRDMGLQQYSLIRVYQQVRRNVDLMTFSTNFMAIMALVVAALGITNTMVMGVLERTREIGVMKAVGARDSHIQLVFLVEGALIGVLGGALGLLCAWLASIPGESMAQSIMARQLNHAVSDQLFVFPAWLILGVPALGTLIATLAAVYPARRAAKVNPIQALRHE
jgi:putative ABC transport system permease protein